MDTNPKQVLQKTTRTLKDDHNIWNFILSLVFIGLLSWFVHSVYKLHGSLPTSISLFDFVLLSLAVFRLTRLVVYDKITRFIRHLFLVSNYSDGADGRAYVSRSHYPGGLFRAIADILYCPWCAGMWIALFVVYFYYRFDFAWFVIMLFAVAGLANGLTLLVNAIGWRAEDLKIEVTDKEESKGQ